RRCVNLVPFAFQPIRNVPPAPAAVPGAVDEHEGLLRTLSLCGGRCAAHGHRTHRGDSAECGAARRFSIAHGVSLDCFCQGCKVAAVRFATIMSRIRLVQPGSMIIKSDPRLKLWPCRFSLGSRTLESRASRPPNSQERK